MDTHVKVLGALQIALGVIGLFSALVLVVVFGVASSAVGLSGEPEAAIALPIIGVTGAALAVSPPRKNTTSPGSTGTMMPSASMSSSTVMKMKTKAAREGAGMLNSCNLVIW